MRCITGEAPEIICEEVITLEKQGYDLIDKISVDGLAIERVERVLGPLFHPQTTAAQMLEKRKDSLKKKNL